MKSLAFVFIILALTACSHSVTPPEQKYQLQTEDKGHIPSECPNVQAGAFQYDNDPTRVVIWSTDVKTGELGITGGGFPDRAVNGKDQMDSNFGHHVASCEHGRIYFQDNSPRGEYRGVITPDSTGYSYFTIDTRAGGKSTTEHFTKL